MASIWKRPQDRDNPDARWLISYHDGTRRRTVSGSANYRASQQIARKLESDGTLRKHGVLDPIQERLAAEGQRAVTEHIADYRSALFAKGCSEKHVAVTIGYVKQMAAGLSWTTIRSVTADAVMKYLAERSQRRKTGRRTANARLVAVKAFTRWMTVHGRIAADPLAVAKRLRESDDRRRIRRTLTTAEFERLIEAAVGGPTLSGITGADRAMFYRVLAATGLRRSEAGSLTRASFDLDGPDGPTVRVDPVYAKNRRETVQPIPDALVGVLRPWLAKRAAGERLWRLPDRTAERLLYPDLARAKIDYGADGGPVVDLHSFRYGYVTTLVRAGVPVKAVQRLARHSDARLTLNIYTSFSIADDRAALALAFGDDIDPKSSMARSA